MNREFRESLREPNRKAIAAVLQRSHKALEDAKEVEREAHSNQERAQKLQADMQRVGEVVGGELEGLFGEVQAEQLREHRRLQNGVLDPLAKEIVDYEAVARRDLLECGEQCEVARRQVGWMERLAAQDEVLNERRLALAMERKEAIADADAFLGMVESAIASAEQALARSRPR